MNEETMILLPYKAMHRQQLLEVWERSAKATHGFVSADDMAYYKTQVAQIDFTAFEVHVAATAEGSIAGFIGVADKRIEMLFLDPPFIGKGLGKRLMRLALDNLEANEVEVNEQNAKAVAFYSSFGFKAYERSDKDGEGRDYPVLRMRLEKKI